MVAEFRPAATWGYRQRQDGHILQSVEFKDLLQAIATHWIGLYCKDMVGACLLHHDQRVKADEGANVPEIHAGSPAIDDRLLHPRFVGPKPEVLLPLQIDQHPQSGGWSARHPHGADTLSTRYHRAQRPF